MISAILLAAGESKRMNGENKLIKKIKGKALIKYSVKNILESSIDELIIITGYQSEVLKEVIGQHKKIKFTYILEKYLIPFICGICQLYIYALYISNSKTIKDY